MFWTHFGYIFPIFWAKIFFLKTRGLSHTMSYVFLASCQNLIKATIPRKCPDRWKDRRTNGRTNRPYFLGPFQLSLGVQKGDKLYVKCKGGDNLFSKNNRNKRYYIKWVITQN